MHETEICQIILQTEHKQIFYSMCLQSITLNSAYQQVKAMKISLSLHLSNGLHVKAR